MADFAAGSTKTHVIVVGGGLAGMTAALCAAESGARVTLVDKEKGVGGNSAKATSGMNAAGTVAQHSAGIPDSPAAFYADTIASGHGLSDPTLTRVLTEQSAAAVAWLNTHGVDLAAVTLCGGHKLPRTHHEAPRADGKPTPVGWDIIAALKREVGGRWADSITVRTGCRVVALTQEDAAAGPRSPVTGVRVVCSSASGAAVGASDTVEELLHADAVVLASGGFGNDHTASSLLAEYAPQLACLPTTNGPFASGDGVKLARAVGAHLVGMEHVQVHPTGFVDRGDVSNPTKFLGPEALRGVGGVLLNHRGRRFVNELDRRDAVSAAMYRHCATHVSGGAVAVSAWEAAGRGMDDMSTPTPAPVHAYIVLTPVGVAAFGPNFAFYHKVKGFFREVEGPAGVAAEIAAATSVDVTADTVTEQLAAYAAAAAGGSADAFGKTAFPDPFTNATDPTGKLYVAVVTPAIHYTMGGVAVNAAAELLYADDGTDEGSAGAPASPAADPATGTAPTPTPSPSPLTTPTPGPTPSPAAATAVAVAAGAGAASHTLTTQRSARRITSTAVLSEIAGLDRGDESGPATDMPVLRPIPRLFGAGEVTGGLHGGNRLAGNSLLECVVFGRIAGRRAAAVGSGTVAPLNPEAFVPLEFRDSYLVAPHIYLVRFNLPSPLHTSGFGVGQYVAVRAVLEGKEIVRYYSPISRPDAQGHIDLLLKIDESGGLMTSHINTLRPGDTLEFKGPLGGLKLDFSPAGDMGAVKRIGLIAGGTGIAPMVQILRSLWHWRRVDVPVKMIYSAAIPSQLAFHRLLRGKQHRHTNFHMFCAVDTVPEGETWGQHVGYVTAPVITTHMWPPADDVLIVICGPFPMCRAIKQTLTALGYAPHMYFSFM